jgi:hypothetical protein
VLFNFPETEELLVNLDPSPSEVLPPDTGDVASRFPNLDLKSRPDIIDVTIPVQCLVEEGSKLNLYEGGSKSDLAGFYDPCAPTTLEMIREQVHVMNLRFGQKASRQIFI